MIELKNISRVYKPGKIPTTALENIYLKVNAGDFLIISGPSGSGKSTLLNLMGLIDQPTSGEIYIDGSLVNYRNEKNLTKLRRSHFGFIFQNFNLIPTLTVFENIEYPLLSAASSFSQRRKMVEESLALVELDTLGKRYPNEISGGQQQRVSIARAIVNKPMIVIADEPTANLDSKTGATILGIMETMNKNSGVTFVLASHDQNVLSLSRSRIHLIDGQIKGESL
jgi:putative ABC transport system ATP-binding protein